MNDELAMTADLDWTKLHGTVLEGGYEVQELLAADQNARSFKIRVLGDGSVPALMKVFSAEGARADEQIALWNSAKDLRHPNLITPLAAGRMEVKGGKVIYVILPRADEVLESALLQRPLGTDEAGELLLNASQALEYLHTQGFVHGCVSPQQVLAVGESVKLSTETIRRIGSKQGIELIDPKYLAPESDGENVNPEADVWCLAATVFQALTQRECAESCRQKAAELPLPFGSIVPRCLDPDPATRCKLTDVPALYRGPKAAARSAAPLPPFELPPARRHVRVAAHSRPRTGRKLWMYAVLGLLVTFAVIWALRPRHITRNSASVAPPASAPTASAPAVPTPAPGTKATMPTRTEKPASAMATNLPAQPGSYALASSNPKTAKQPGATVNGPIWRVVLYTYARAEDARNMAHSINEKHHQLNAEVFSPEGQNSPYLVVAGGQMSYEEAARLRRKVVSMGLPRDSYIQNYKR